MCSWQFSELSAEGRTLQPHVTTVLTQDLSGSGNAYLLIHTYAQARTHTQAGTHMDTYPRSAYICSLYIHLSFSSPHMNAVRAVHLQLSGRPVKSTLSHLKTIIIVGWQNAAIYTKRTWLLSTFSTPLALYRIVSHTNQPTNQPITQSFGSDVFTTSSPPGQGEKAGLVWFVLSVWLQNLKERQWRCWWGCPVIDTQVNILQDGKPRHEREKTGCPLLMSPPSDLPLASQIFPQGECGLAHDSHCGFPPLTHATQERGKLHNVLFVKLKHAQTRLRQKDLEFY